MTCINELILSLYCSEMLPYKLSYYYRIEGRYCTYVNQFSSESRNFLSAIAEVRTLTAFYIISALTNLPHLTRINHIT